MRQLHLVAALVLIGTTARVLGADAPDKLTKPAANPHITVSKETTYITAPLRPDGSVDYLKSLNEPPEGVTPENNAAVMFFKAMGPGMVQQPYRDQYYKMLGIPPLPEEAHLVPFDKSAEASKPAAPEQRPNHDIWQQHDQAMKRPWKTDEFPVVASRLTANKQSLDLVVEASQRPRCYNPMISPRDGPLIGDMLPAPQAGAGGDLHFGNPPAMRHLDDGEVNRAWVDLLACHRLARLSAPGAHAGALPGIHRRQRTSLKTRTRSCCRTCGSRSPRRRRNCRQILATLPPLPKMSDKIERGERFVYLDSVAMVAREGIGLLQQLEGPFGRRSDLVRFLSNDDTQRWIGAWSFATVTSGTTVMSRLDASPLGPSDTCRDRRSTPIWPVS